MSITDGGTLARCGRLNSAPLAGRLASLTSVSSGSGTSYYDPGDLAERIAAIMRAVPPDVVLTFHEAIGGHPDHCAIGRATRRAYELAGGEASLCYVMGGWMSYEEQ